MYMFTGKQQIDRFLGANADMSCTAKQLRTTIMNEQNKKRREGQERVTGA